MATETVVTDGTNYKHVDYDKSKLLLFGGETRKGTFKNNTGVLADFPVGQLLGRDNSDGSLVPLDLSNAAAGEDNVVGILFQELSQIADAGTQDDVSILTSGEVAENKVVLIAPDTLDSANAAGLLLRDDLKRVGITLRDVDEAYDFDNQ